MICRHCGRVIEYNGYDWIHVATKQMFCQAQLAEPYRFVPQ